MNSRQPWAGFGPTDEGRPSLCRRREEARVVQSGDSLHSKKPATEEVKMTLGLEVQL